MPKEMTLHDVLKILIEAERLGASTDEPEGTRFIQISDTLAKKMIDVIQDGIWIYHPPKRDEDAEALGSDPRHHSC